MKSDSSGLGRAGLAIILAALAMLGPFSIDTYLPAFPSIQAGLQATPLEVQQTLTAYMLSFAIMTLWHGALSDAFGRRNVILVALAVFAVASFGCASAHSIHYLWGFRILQGISAGAGMVVGRAIIRDLYAGAQAERLLSLVTMIFSIAPAIAPILGGWIVVFMSWRAIFLLLFGYTIALWLACFKLLPESLPKEKRQEFSAEFLWESYAKVFKSPLFHLKAGTIAFNFGGLFLYISAAPVFITQHLHLGADQFGWQFIPSVGGIFLGALTANRLAGKISVWKQVSIGFCFLIGASLFNVAFHLFSVPVLFWSVMPLFFYTFGMSLVAPGATLLVLDLFPSIRGIVASCQSASVTLIGAVIAGVVAPLLDHSVLALAAGQLACALTGATLWYTGRAYWRSMTAQKQNAWETVG
ncbi:multidrug effflux MFS transporter [Undibacterium oligocarboniphilum]|uniref:Bcr/CflA family efflux transporter n=1 Tax=Undibacterium oligocarboniphilum TaxID=666702 RepID=A0A850QJE4_9BURK|nr:multidrug effflux MFS transporter [Undibacterium oligocarboniphilum]MBC3869887.1 multidrug effflux MFS transporter [Undibacterium oligocarboniphilum]NVO77503.1 multidrug effflux MFS transporter [Undibacterium oligocarboniphilum]